MASGRNPRPGEFAGQAWDGFVRLSAAHFLRIVTVYRRWGALRASVPPPPPLSQER